MGTTRNPEEYGWKLRGGHLVPIRTDFQPAPQNITKCYEMQLQIQMQSIKMYLQETWT